ncbi:Amino acid permease family protein [Aspergillus niger]|uniref:Amino acid permease family protein n=1 Tax=Aspergillus niger TaxID=5061 RepID=A0A505IC61_ASPNG|nr:Amino acid permease family protein [Aspergillus niger]
MTFRRCALKNSEDPTREPTRFCMGQPDPRLSANDTSSGVARSSGAHAYFSLGLYSLHRAAWTSTLLRYLYPA